MAHHDNNENLSPQEVKFNDCISRGDGFMVIDQYLYAKECYNEAFELHFNDSVVNEKLRNLSKKQKYERKTILKIVVAAVLIVAAVIIYKTHS